MIASLSSRRADNRKSARWSSRKLGAHSRARWQTGDEIRSADQHTKGRLEVAPTSSLLHSHLEARILRQRCSTTISYRLAGAQRNVMAGDRLSARGGRRRDWRATSTKSNREPPTKTMGVNSRICRGDLEASWSQNPPAPFMAEREERPPLAPHEIGLTFASSQLSYEPSQ